MCLFSCVRVCVRKGACNITGTMQPAISQAPCNITGTMQYHRHHAACHHSRHATMPKASRANGGHRSKMHVGQLTPGTEAFVLCVSP